MKKPRFDEGGAVVPDARDMKNHPILPLLLSAVAVSAAPANIPAELKYDRVAVEYASGGDGRSYGISGEALLGGHFLLGGGVLENKFKQYGTTAGRSTGFKLGYKFTLGQGDLIASALYGQVQASGQIPASGTTGAKSIALQGSETTYDLTWRQRINENYEFSVGYDYATSRQTLRSTLGTTVTNVATKDHVDSVNLGLRYNFSANLDVTLGYSFVSGGNVWSLSTGYSF